MNILLVETEEHRLDENGEQYMEEEEEENTSGRFVGQVLIPWKIIQKIEVQETEKPASKLRTHHYDSMEYI